MHHVIVVVYLWAGRPKRADPMFYELAFARTTTNGVGKSALLSRNRILPTKIRQFAVISDSSSAVGGVD